MCALNKGWPCVFDKLQIPYAALLALLGVFVLGKQTQQISLLVSGKMGDLGINCGYIHYSKKNPSEEGLSFLTFQ
jgi:hypothetical protein